MPKPANYKTIEGIREKIGKQDISYNKCIDRQDICEIRDRGML